MDKKRAAGEKAAELVEGGMVVGLGTGSTAYFAIEALGNRIRSGLEMVGVATSKGTEGLAAKFGVPLVDLDEVEVVDMTIDGADEVDPSLNLIKGMGGALMREKIVAYASLEEVIIVDDSKLVERLGTKSPLPVEVSAFGHKKTKRALEDLGCTAALKGGSSPFITDNGNLIYECRFEKIEDPEFLEAEIHLIPGVLESGLFIELATMAIVGEENGVRMMRRT